jgi:hypothetical protein
MISSIRTSSDGTACMIEVNADMLRNWQAYILAPPVLDVMMALSLVATNSCCDAPAGYSFERCVVPSQPGRTAQLTFYVEQSSAGTYSLTACDSVTGDLVVMLKEVASKSGHGEQLLLHQEWRATPTVVSDYTGLTVLLAGIPNTCTSLREILLQGGAVNCVVTNIANDLVDAARCDWQWSMLVECVASDAVAPFVGNGCSDSRKSCTRAVTTVDILSALC